MKRTEERIIECFRSSPKAEQSITQLANSLKTSYPNVFNTAKSLEAKGILTIRKQGNTSRCRINLHSDEAVLLLAWLETVNKAKNFNDAASRIIEKRIFLEENASIFCCFIIGNQVIGITRKIESTESLSFLEKAAPGFKALIVDSEGFTKLLERQDLSRRIVLWGFESFYRAIGEGK